jgi:hypothetical protein
MSYEENKIQHQIEGGLHIKDEYEKYMAKLEQQIKELEDSFRDIEAILLSQGITSKRVILNIIKQALKK